MNELTCPYCNAVVPLHGPLQAGQMLTCSRCEERFIALRSVQAAPVASPSQPAPVAPPRRLSNRTVALIVLVVMGSMAALATTFALMTQKDRRANDTGLRQSRSNKRHQQQDLEQHSRQSPRPPLEMSALHLLPADMDILAGVDAVLVLRQPEGRALLQRDVPALKGSIETRFLKRLKELTGIDAEDVDHLVVGARSKDTSIVVALKTRSDFEPAKLVKRLRAELHSQARGEKIYHFRQELSPLHSSGLMNCLDERTLLLAWEGKLSDVLPSRRKDGQTPRPELAALLRERVRPAGALWVAGQLDGAYLQLLSQLLSVAEPDRKALLGLRSFAVWVTLDPQVTVYAVARASDEKARDAMETSLRGKFAEKSDVKLIADKADKEWLTLQYRPEK